MHGHFAKWVGGTLHECVSPKLTQCCVAGGAGGTLCTAAGLGEIGCFAIGTDETPLKIDPPRISLQTDSLGKKFVKVVLLPVDICFARISSSVCSYRCKVLRANFLFVCTVGKSWSNNPIPETTTIKNPTKRTIVLDLWRNIDLKGLFV